jgi:hypothetical protein
MACTGYTLVLLDLLDVTNALSFVSSALPLSCLLFGYKTQIKDKAAGVGEVN